MNWEEAKALKTGDLVKYHNEFWGEEFICVVPAGWSEDKIDNFIDVQLLTIICDDNNEVDGDGHIITPINSTYWEKIA